MSASSAHREACGSDLKDAVGLLERALRILDANNVSPDVGARLQDVIEQVKAANTQA
jgi:hypothetical protein